MSAVRSRRIEFLGPPGVGKTTLYNVLLPRLKEIKDVIGQPDLSPRAALAKGGLSPLRRAFGRARLDYAPPAHRRDYRKRLEARIASEADEAIAALEQIQIFLALCFEALAEQNDALLQVRRARWLLEGLRQAAIADLLYNREYVLFDELLCQSGFGIGIAARDSGRLWSGYFAAVPAPFAVIALTASPELIARRLALRERSHSRHFDTITAGGTFIKIALEMLARRGTKVMIVNSETNPDQIVEMALEQLRTWAE